VGKSVELWYTHAYGGWYDKYHKDHPDWFALQPDHTRNQTPPRERLCVSNMGLIEEIARDKIAYLKENPNMLCASISPNDGGRNAFCMCENCRKLDPVDAPPIEYTYYKGPVKTTVPYVSLSDRYVWFYSRIAERVAKELPDRYVGAYAYSIYRTPPVRQKLHDNVIIGLVAFSYMNDDARDKGFEQWQGWRKNAKNLFLRPNAFFVAGGGPVNFARAIAADFKKLHADGLRIVDYDGWVGNWGSQGLSVYVLAKVLWNPAADVDALIRDYVQKGFGPAAGPVGEYFQALEDFTTAIAKARDYRGMKTDSRLLMGKYDDAFLSRMRAILDRARQAAAQDPVVLARIAKLSAGLDYAEALRESILNKNPEKLKAFRLAHALDFTVNVECLKVLR